MKINIFLHIVSVHKCQEGVYCQVVVIVVLPTLFISLLLVSLLGRLGFLSGNILRGGRLDHANGNGLSHVSDGETSKGRVLGESLHAHRLAGDKPDDGGVTRLDELRVLLGGLAGTPVDLLLDLGKLAGNVGGVTIEHGGVAVGHLARVVEHDHLGGEVGHAGGGALLGVGGHVATLDVLDGHVLDVEADVVSGHSLGHLLVVHLDGLDLSGELAGGKGDDHVGLDDTSLNPAHGDCSNAANLVHVLEGQTK